MFRHGKLLLPGNWHRIRDAWWQRWAMYQYRRRFGGGSGTGTGLIGYACFAGLANRLQAHLVALALGHRSGLPVVPIWPRNRQCGANFEDLFRAEPLARVPRFDEAVVIPVSDDPLDGIPIVPGKLNLLDFRWQYEDVFRTERWGLRDWALERLSFSPAVEARLAALPLREGRPRVGVHIRRGDFVTRTGQARPLSAYVEVVRKILRELPAALIYLSTDGSDDVREAFRESLTECPVVWNELSTARDSAESIRDALCDVVELSRCDALVLTGRSSFGRLAQFFSRRPQVVAVVR